MKTHIQHEDMTLSKCGEFDPSDDFTTDAEAATCLECRFYDRAQEAWEAYVAQPTEFGGESHVVRIAEHDGFFAGYFAAIRETVPF